MQREKQAYDEGSVHEESTNLQRKFWHVFESPNSKRAELYYSQSIEQFASNKIVLDYGCYDGWFFESLIRYHPARIIGIDISEKGIAEAKRKFGDRAEYYVMDAHKLTFPDNTFDVVIGRSILHHLDLDVAIREIHRVLKPNGKAIFIEPLGDNPFAKFIRFLTPRARTKDEKPLEKKDIRKMDDMFRGHSHLFFNLFSVPIGMITSLVSQNPNNIFLRLADGLDQIFSVSVLRYWMRQVVLVWTKSE
jgi:ubiquinone/menaquinone biosynthesis C-methylase UbiE